MVPTGGSLVAQGTFFLPCLETFLLSQLRWEGGSWQLVSRGWRCPGCPATPRTFAPKRGSSTVPDACGAQAEKRRHEVVSGLPACAPRQADSPTQTWHLRAVFFFHLMVLSPSWIRVVLSFPNPFSMRMSLIIQSASFVAVFIQRGVSFVHGECATRDSKGQNSAKRDPGRSGNPFLKSSPDDPDVRLLFRTTGLAHGLRSRTWISIRFPCLRYVVLGKWLSLSHLPTAVSKGCCEDVQGHTQCVPPCQP